MDNKEEILSPHSAEQRDSIYPGDIDDVTATPIKEGGYQVLSFDDPALLVNFFDPQLSSGEVTLHKWQTELLESFAAVKPTSLQPHKFALVASNGSGKDAFIVAPFAIWFALTKKQSRVIVTSSSGSQLTAQTENYIRALAEAVNKFAGCEYFRIRQRYIKCRLSGSEIRLFATDEAGRAEGYHPMVPNAEMAIIVNEAKSVTDEIHHALRRCTGFNYWVEVSTPGEPTGYFHKIATTYQQVELKEIPIAIKKSGNYTTRVTSYDCPHISLEEINEDKLDLGEHSPYFRSKHLALFTSIGGEVIIPLDLIEKLQTNPPRYKILNWPTRIGIDLAAGAAENVVTFVRGNKIKEYAFRESDTTITAERIEQILKDEGIDKSHEYIWADDGGVGHSIIDMLVRRGWNIKRLLNQWAAINKRNFGNRGAENWYRCKRFFEEGFIDVTQLSELTITQLTNRRYKKSLLGARVYLESKKEAIANGRPSPDRADAFILALTGLNLDDFISAKTSNSPVELKHREGEILLRTQEEVRDYYTENVQYALFNGIDTKPKHRGNGGRIFNSLRKALSKDKNKYERLSNIS